jgi:hypothetical protein
VPVKQVTLEDQAVAHEVVVAVATLVALELQAKEITVDHLLAHQVTALEAAVAQPRLAAQEQLGQTATVAMVFVGLMVTIMPEAAVVP